MDERKVIFSGKIPDPFLKSDGTRMTPEEWWQQRDRIRDFIVDMEYGGMPPRPEVVKLQRLDCRVRNSLWFRITAGTKERQLSFYMLLCIPSLRGSMSAPLEEGEKYPVLLTGDGCWLNMDTEAINEITARGYIVARFNRLELAPDIPSAEREGGLYDIYPENQDFTAISAWAWGYMTVMDALEQLPFVDITEVGITGHSRGGKTALLAGTMDDRIKYVCPNNSGCHGAASYRTTVLDQGSAKERTEFLIHMFRYFPHWMGKKLEPYAERVQDLPYDMNYFGTVIAPRYYFQIEGMQDYWTNPIGSWQTFMAVREAHRYLGIEGHAAIWVRAGGHRQKLPEYSQFMDFMDCIRNGEPLKEEWEINPYPGIEKNFDW